MDVFYLRAFWDLSSTRLFQFGHIPWDAIVKYGHHVGLDADIIDAFVAIVRTMDEGYLNWMMDQAERQREQNTPPPPKSPEPVHRKRK